jgi:hypothetical protein
VPGIAPEAPTAAAVLLHSTAAPELRIGFDDGSTMTVQTGGFVGSASTGGTVKAVRQQDTRLNLDFNPSEHCSPERRGSRPPPGQHEPWGQVQMDARWRIELLGRLRAVQGDRGLTRFRTQKTRCLLAYLAYDVQRSHPREELIEMLWPESDLDAGRGNLSTELHSLRRQLEPPGVPAGAVIVADRFAVQLNPAACSRGLNRAVSRGTKDRGPS